MSSSRSDNSGISGILVGLGTGYLRLLEKTSRMSVRRDPAFTSLLGSGRGIIFTFWHNQLLFMPCVYSRWLSGRRMAVIASQSRDGELIGAIIARFGLRSIRGSTSRGGRKALLNLFRSILNGWDAVVTPDGPRGPRYRVQEGVVGLASSTGAPIVAVSSHGDFKLVLRRSWDHLRVPLPGGRIRAAFSAPLWVPRGIGREERAFFCRKLEGILRETAARAVGKPG